MPVGAPWRAAKAAEYDGETLADYIRRNSSTKRFRELVPAATRLIFGAEPRELSLLFTLFYVASSGDERNPGSFERNFNTRGGAQMFRFVGGSQLIALRVAKSLGNRVVLRSPVRRIAQGSSGVSVFSDRVNVHAKRAIVAMAPALAGRLHYTPQMPALRAGLTQRYRQGALTKVAAVYDRPFWREKGLTGSALAATGLVSATFDGSPPGGKPGVVFGLVGGDQSRGYGRMSRGARRAAVLDELAAFFGEEALRPRDYFDTRWTAERWSRGCPVGIARPGILTKFGPALRQPVGRIHWAGTETSTYWNGYMDGAVRSGERRPRSPQPALTKFLAGGLIRGNFGSGQARPRLPALSLRPPSSAPRRSARRSSRAASHPLETVQDAGVSDREPGRSLVVHSERLASLQRDASFQVEGGALPGGEAPPNVFAAHWVAEGWVAEGWVAGLGQFAGCGRSSR